MQLPYIIKSTENTVRLSGELISFQNPFIRWNLFLLFFKAFFRFSFCIHQSCTLNFYILYFVLCAPISCTFHLFSSFFSFAWLLHTILFRLCFFYFKFKLCMVKRFVAICRSVNLVHIRRIDNNSISFWFA